MAKDKGLNPTEFLDRFFDEIRDEARSNPKFASRLVKAMGGEVVFENDQKTDVANPYIIAANSSKPEFYKTFATLKVGQLKQLLRENNLATRIDMTGKSATQLVDMLYDRAASKVSERRSTLF